MVNLEEWFPDLLEIFKLKKGMVDYVLYNISDLQCF